MSRPRRAFPFALLLAAVAGVSCGAAGKSSSPQPASARTTSAAPLETSPRVAMPSGAVYRVELAKTPEEQAQGLMFRESLLAHSGMLFLLSKVSVHKFWMKNTMIPLDMIWLDETGKVIFVSANTPPCKADPCPNYGPDAPASSVLEIAGGMAAKEGVQVGSTLRIVDAR